MTACANQVGRFCVIAGFCFAMLCQTSIALSADSLERRASWEVYDVSAMSQMLRGGLDTLGVTPDTMDVVTEKFLDAIEQDDTDSLDAYVQAVRPHSDAVDGIVTGADESLVKAAAMIDPNAPGYADVESLPKSMRASVRTWLARELVRQRLYDEALPVIAEIDPVDCVDPAATLFYRGACYHALVMKKEALSDLRRLLENEDKCPVRFARTAKMMVADIKPLKVDSLDEISRIMTDITRRLDLGQADEDVTDQEQKAIDKLSKIIDKIEEEQKKQQQQQQSGSGGGSGSPNNQQSSPMQDSQAGGASGDGDVDRRDLGDRDGWGNLPPAEREQALQQIGQDLPTHYREAIKAYFRKIATDK